MTAHQLLPLGAFVLNLILVALALFRNAKSRLNRVFAYGITAMAVWNYGVFMLRRAPDEHAAWVAEVVVHIGVPLIPVLYYHFVVIFLDSTRARRRSLTVGYALAALFEVLNLTGSPLFMKGVTYTTWGWAPAAGPLYLPFFLYVNTGLLLGPWYLIRAQRHAESSFHRNRSRLIVLATYITLGGGIIDFVRFIVAKFVPAAEYIYPVGIPANLLFALLLGTSIVRYRLFDVSALMRRTSVYAVVGVAAAGALVGVVYTLEQGLGWSHFAALAVATPLALVVARCTGPLEHAVERFLRSQRRGCHDTLVSLSTRVSTLMDFKLLVDTIVHGVVRGIPLTHAALLTLDRETNRFVVQGRLAVVEDMPEPGPLPVDGAVVRWLQQDDGVLVKEEAKINPRVAEHFEAVEDELEAVPAAVIVPLKIERRLIGILLLGEKLSGDIFDIPELEVLSVVGNQSAVALENARLYEQLGTSNAQLTEASRHKTAFLAGMSHELRTPLNAITGFSKLLMNKVDGDLTPLQTTYVESIHASSVHLLQLVNGVLDVSRIEAGKVDLRREAVNVAAVVEECLVSARALAPGKPVRIDADVPADLPPADADRTKLKQVVLNLVSNAVKFTPRGRVVVRVRDEGSGLHVMVADTGAGIRQQDLPHLFEAFRRFEHGAARDEGGTGLGLLLSKRIVELHGGRIWAESRENQGSTFHFTVPAARLTTEGLVTA